MTALLIIAMGCASRVLKADKSDEILRNAEFENAVAVKEIAADDPHLQSAGTYVLLPGPEPVPEAFQPPPKPLTRAEKRKLARAAKTAESAAEALGASASGLSGTAVTVNDSQTPDSGVVAHQPGLEDSEGFIGRRPEKDPFRVGEKVTLEVSYFGVVGGDMTIETRNFVNVNGHKSYTFAGTAHSTSVFAMFYAVDDWFETFVDYDTLLPASYSLHVKESKQLRETRTIFDHQAHSAKYWDKKINEEKKLEETQNTWQIPSYVQNVFTAGYYIRNFQLTPGKKIQFRVAHENENLVISYDVLRRERITTPAGEFDTVVLKPVIALDGVFKPVGDIFVWLTDDDRKLIVRMEGKIKIGTIVGVAKQVDLGRE